MSAPDPISLTSRPDGFGVLDVRSEAAFATGHIAGSGNIPVTEFASRRTELPPRDAAILVVAATAEEAGTAAAGLEALGYTRVRWLDAPLDLVAGGLADTGPAVRLWRPAPFLVEMLPRLERGRARDQAAGAGREAVFLALHGFEVEAMDDDPKILAKADALAARCGVRIDTRVMDLERRDTVLPEGRYALVTVFRFLHRIARAHHSH